MTDKYKRSDYVLMTKVGRIAAAEFDYSPAWIRHSVTRSLERLHTTYFDVVFCHDVEYVTDEDAVTAVGVLLELVAEGKIRYVGVSGYVLDKLVRIANLVQKRYGRPLDAVQNWGQLTLQNTRMEKEGLPALRAAGVDCIFNSSPLGIGLLRSGGVPTGALGDWHPAPQGLRRAVLEASDWVEARGENLAALALRFCISSLMRASNESRGTSMVIAANSVAELEANLQSIGMILRARPGAQKLYGDVRDWDTVDEVQLEKDTPFYDGVRKALGQWIDYTFTSPEPEWDVELKKMRPSVHLQQEEIGVARL